MNVDKMIKDVNYERFNELYKKRIEGSYMSESEIDEYNSILDEYLM